MSHHLVFVAPGRVAWQPTRTQKSSVGSLESGLMRARGLFSGISQGTELLLFRGEGCRVFDATLPQANAETSYPSRYGYCWVGEVTHSEDKNWLGKRIFSLQTHASEHDVHTSQAWLIPDDVPSTRATLAANMETALNVVWDARIMLGDRVLVFGGGVVGQLICHLARQSGAHEVVCIERSAHRRARALQLGATQAYGEPPPSLSPFSIVIEATGDPSVLNQCFALGDERARVVMASNYGARTAPVLLGEVFHRRQQQLIASHVWRVAADRPGNWTIAQRRELAMQLLRNATLDLLLEEPIAAERAQEIYDRLATGQNSTLHTMLRY